MTLAYYAGYCAAHDPKPIQANPHPPGTLAAASWLDGHDDAWLDAHAAMRTMCGRLPVIIAQFDAAQRSALRRSNHA